MSYSIHITQIAEQDLNNAIDYIDLTLLNPQAADALIDEVEIKIGGLSDFPEKFALVDDPILKSWGIRFIVIKKYLAFYIISKSNNTVYIVRFLYGKRNWINILKHGFSLE